MAHRINKNTVRRVKNRSGGVGAAPDYYRRMSNPRVLACSEHIHVIVHRVYQL